MKLNKEDYVGFLRACYIKNMEFKHYGSNVMIQGSKTMVDRWNHVTHEFYLSCGSTIVISMGKE